jgi:hypothetical protein
MSLGLSRVLVARSGDRFGRFADSDVEHVFVPSQVWQIESGLRAVARCNQAGIARLSRKQIVPPQVVCEGCREHTRPV